MRIIYYDGRQIFFQPLEMADEPLLRRWINHPDNWQTLAWFRPVNELREREFIEKLYKEPTDVALGIVVRETERLIGVTGLHRIDQVARRASFGIMIGDPEYRGKGYGTEATRLMISYGFRVLNLNRIGLSVYAGNKPAIRAYRRAGFIQEGRRRQSFYRNGAYEDELQFGILRNEWRGDAGPSFEDAEAVREAVRKSGT